MAQMGGEKAKERKPFGERGPDQEVASDDIIGELLDKRCRKSISDLKQ
jgi:hypothetical protein